jgi:ABC-type glycerol-3-phosphate transport system permease component
MRLTYEQWLEVRKLTFTVIAWGFLAATAFPLYWMLVSSLKGDAEILAYPPTMWPRELTLLNFQRLLAGDFMIWFVNSVFVALSTTALVIVVGTLAAYSLTRFDYPGREVLAFSVLFTYMFPSVLMLLPLFLIVNNLRLNDTYLALILANTTFALPFAMWLLRSYFASIPIQIEEAAMIDGAPRLGAFIEVVLPQAVPGIISTAIFTFIRAWNDYLFALVFISTASRKTLPIGIASYANELTTQWGPLMAASVAVTVPALIFFMVLQRRLVSGFGSGAVKG